MVYAASKRYRGHKGPAPVHTQVKEGIDAIMLHSVRPLWHEWREGQ